MNKKRPGSARISIWNFIFVPSSVTRFGEILPLWPSVKSLMAIFYA